MAQRPEPAPSETSRAVLIGVSEYDGAGFTQLGTAANSLDAMYAMLTDPALCGWDEDHVTVVRNPSSPAELGSRIADAAESATGTLLVYYVGHGKIDDRGRLYLTVTSTNPSRLEFSGLSWETVRGVLRPGRCAAQVKLAILDCCFAGHAIEAMAGGGPDQALADSAVAEGTYTLTATTRNRLAHTPDAQAAPDACTSFTGELKDLVRQGAAGRGPWLTLADLYPMLRTRLAERGLPQPLQRNTDSADRFRFTHNAAYLPGKVADPPDDEVKVPEPARPSARTTSPALPRFIQPPARRRFSPEQRDSWDLATSGTIHAAAFSPDEAMLVVAGSDHDVQIWDPDAREPVGSFPTGHKGDVYSVAFSPDGTTLATGSGDWTVRLWDPYTGTRQGNPLTSHRDRVRAVAFSPDGAILATAGDDEKVRIWDRRSHRQITPPLTGHSAWVRTLAFSPDGALLVTGSGDATVRVWNSRTHFPFGEPMTAHRARVRAAAFAPYGSLVATGGDDLLVRCWDPRTGQEVGRPLTGHDGPVLALAFAPGGGPLVSAGADGTVRFWDPRAGRQIGAAIDTRQKEVRALAFAGSGTMLVTVGSERTTVWRMEPSAGA